MLTICGLVLLFAVIAGLGTFLIPIIGLVGGFVFVALDILVLLSPILIFKGIRKLCKRKK